MGIKALFLGVERPGRESDHSSQSSAKIKKAGNYTSNSPNTPSWSGTRLKKHRDNFTLSFLLYNEINFVRNIDSKMNSKQRYLICMWLFVVEVDGKVVPTLISPTPRTRMEEWR